VEFFAEMTAPPGPPAASLYANQDQSDVPDTLTRDAAYGGLLTGPFKNVPCPAAISDVKNPPAFYFTNNSMKDLWMAVTLAKP
jgi:hypothetical protein